MSSLDKIAKLLDLFGGNQSAYGIPFANRNYIVDGNFDQWVASSFTLTTGATYGGPVMYSVSAGTGGAGTLASADGTGQYPLGMTTPNRYYASMTIATGSTGTVAASSAAAISQHVESARTLSGQSATFSCWLWTASGTMTIPSTLVRQNFGTGGSPSSGVSLDQAVNWVVTTTPQRFSVLVNFPSINGKTLGTSGNDYLNIGLWLPPGVTGTLNTTQWQLEQSSPQAPAAGMPTTFEYRGYQAELARVQRYYEAGSLFMQSGAAAVSGGMIAYKVTKRAPGALSFSNTSYASASGIQAVGLGGTNTTDMCGINFTASVASGYVVSNWASDARL
jgi:hypothetical protein